MGFDYLNIISGGESEVVEFKKSTASMREIVETICAFANHKGGMVFIGVNDDGNIIGQAVTDDTIQNVTNSIIVNTESKLFPSIEKVILNNKQCIVISVEESPLRPHLAYGRPFKRVGASTVRLDRDQYEYMLLQKYNGYGFDYRLNKNAVLSDINESDVYNFVDKANNIRSLNESLYLPADVILGKLELMKDGYLTNAAILLFGKNPSKFFLGNYETKCGYFPHESSYDVTINDKELQGNLIDQFNAIMQFVIDSIATSTVKQNVYRNEQLEIPLPLIREAIVNMIVHRDYRQNVKNTIEIRPRTINFSNPAFLFAPTITIEKLKEAHSSRPGNKLIARMFYLLGVFENWGSGTLKIIDESIKAGLKEPVFTFEAELFTIKILRQKDNNIFVERELTK